MSLNQTKNRPIEHVVSATHSMLKKRAHYTDPVHGPVWVLTRSERDAILHYFNEGALARRRAAASLRKLANPVGPMPEGAYVD